MIIRDATKKDLEFIAELEAICWGVDGASLDDFLQFFSKKNKYEYLQIIESEEGPLGFIGYSYYEQNRSLEIWNLAIFPQHRGNYHSESLLNRAISIGKSLRAKKITLKVSENNIAAIKLYTKLGFEKVLKTDKYYPDGSSCLVLSFSI